MGGEEKYKVVWGNFRGLDGNSLYLHCGGSYMTVCLSTGKQLDTKSKILPNVNYASAKIWSSKNLWNNDVITENL